MEKVIDIEDRIPTLRKKRKRRTNIKFASIISLFFATLFLLLYFQSPYSDVQKITIYGAGLKDDDYYIEKSGVHIGDSMWGINSSEIEEKLQEKWIKNVEVKRKWLTSVEIHIDEYRKVAYISENNHFYPMLENGYVFKDTSLAVPVDAPIFSQFENKTYQKLLLEQLSKLDEEVLALISQINATPTETDPYRITLFMNDGYEVRAEISSLAEKLNYYPSIIAQIEKDGGFEKGVIDIEVGSYYKSYTKEYAGLEENIQTEKEEELEQDVGADEESISQQEAQ